MAVGVQATVTEVIVDVGVTVPPPPPVPLVLPPPQPVRRRAIERARIVSGLNNPANTLLISRRNTGTGRLR
jgi:hypothetical protein